METKVEVSATKEVVVEVVGLEAEREILVKELTEELSILSFENEKTSLLMKDVTDLGQELGYSPKQINTMKEQISSNSRGIKTKGEYLAWVVGPDFMTNTEIRRIVTEHLASQDLLYDYATVESFMGEMYGPFISRMDTSGWIWMPLSGLPESWKRKIHVWKRLCLQGTSPYTSGDTPKSGKHVVIGGVEKAKTWFGEHRWSDSRREMSILASTYQEEVPLFALRRAKEIKDLIAPYIDKISKAPGVMRAPLLVVSHPLKNVFTQLNSDIEKARTDDEWRRLEYLRKLKEDPFAALFFDDGLPPLVFAHWNEPGFTRMVTEGNSPTEMVKAVDNISFTKRMKNKKELVNAYALLGFFALIFIVMFYMSVVR